MQTGSKTWLATSPSRCALGAAWLLLLLAGCGGGGSSGGGGGSTAPPPPPPTPAPVVSLTTFVLSLARGATSTVTWSATNASSCTAAGGWSGARPANGTETIGPLTANANYTLTCSGTGGTGNASVNVSFRPVPVITLTANPARVLFGQTATLTWSTTDATSCAGLPVSSATPHPGWAGTQPTNGTFTTGQLSGQTVFTLECSGPEGTTEALTRVDATPAGMVFLSASQPTAYLDEPAEIVWNSFFVTDCVASGAWSGPRPTSGRFTTAPLTTRTEFTLSCQDVTGPVVGVLTLIPEQRPPPTVFINAQPTSITAGTLVTLGWSTSHADSCVAAGGWSGSQPTSGSQVLTSLSVTTVYTLTCTGRGGTTSASTTVTVTGPNQPPIADAGADRTAYWGQRVQLDAFNSSDPGGSIVSYAWTQVAGPTQALTNSNSPVPYFDAPQVATNTVLRFQLIVTDNLGLTSTPDFVDITLVPPPGGVVILQGRVTYERVPFAATLGSGLDYNAIRREPARGVSVQLLEQGTQFRYASTATDANGNYSVSVPAGRWITVSVIAEMVRAAPQPLPHWNVRVRNDSDANATTYNTFGSPVFSGTGTSSADVNIPAGWDPATRQPNNTRAAAPFAILDTIYRSIQTVLSVEPAAAFPLLTIAWSTTNGVGTTFYQDDNGTDGRYISLAGQAGLDIDEYDPHTIAHEFGHYIEDRFSRADSIGGAHSFGDVLDPRVAFGEGFGYAFSAIVLNDPQIRDAIGPGQSNEIYFNVETDSGTNEGWYSEGSVQEIIWDLYDSANDGDDTLSLGLAPLWAILTGAQRTTESFTTIFQFVAALKAANPAAATQINAIVAGEATVAPTIEPYASTETNAAQATPTTDVLPIYTNIGTGTGAVTVRSVGNFGIYNKLSNSRFLRLQSSGAQRVRITATTPDGRDPDVVVWYRGQPIAVGDTASNESITVDLGAGTYLLETYECGNGDCGGSPGAYDITITVTPF